MRDYVAWHDDYDEPGSRLHLRLLVVQDLIAHALDELPAGPIRVISMCAGQGRDIVTVAARHRRGADVRGRLVELDERNVADARGRIAAAGLNRLEVVQADAGWSTAYDGASPADLVLVCGVFGNISADDIATTIRFLPSLCAPGAWIVWTRHPTDMTVIETVDRLVVEAGFETPIRVLSAAEGFCVGAARLDGPPASYVPETRLFTFTR